MGRQAGKPKHSYCWKMVSNITLVYLCFVAATCVGIRAADGSHVRANSETPPDTNTHDALWKNQCNNVLEVYVVKHGDTPKKLMNKTYRGVLWEPMWSLVALCNSKAVASFNPGLEGTAQVPEGLSLNLPVFQLPGIVATSHTDAVLQQQQQQQQQQNTSMKTAENSGIAGSQPQVESAAGISSGVRSRGTSSTTGSSSSGGGTIGSSNSSSGTTSTSSSSMQATTAWLSPLICGCGEQIPIVQPSSWLQVAQQAYPNTQHLQTTVLLLSICNPDAALTAHMLLQPGQQLVGICAETAALAAAAAAASTSPPRRSHDSSVGSTVLSTGSTTTSSTGSRTAAVAATAAARRHRRAAVPLQQSAEEVPACLVTTLSGQGSYLRQVSVEPAAACPWYADGCSGPTEGLQYQDVLTPCCNAHDYCYLCSYKLGWSGGDGRKNCDHLMLSNMLKACEGSFPIGGWWDWKAKWHKFWCDSTANVMFAAVWAYQELKGGTVHEHLQCPGDYGPVLGAADFCFYR